MKFIITLIAVILLGNLGHAFTDGYSKLDSFFNILEQENCFLGSVAVSQSGKIIYSRALGYNEVNAETPNTIETKFRIGSITKTLTSTLIMKAVEMGKLSLDEKIDAYFPSIRNADAITITHLLKHRSGIKTFTDRDFLTWYQEPKSRAELLDEIVNRGVNFQPNERYEYSNSNYALLTFILEEIYGDNYAKILDSQIVEPLGLKNTTYGGVINPLENEARSYRMKGEWTLEPEGDMSIPLGAGGVVSSPSDLCIFAGALFHGEIISLESLDKMMPGPDGSYGFALEPQKFDDKIGVGHGGDIDAFTSLLVYFQEEDLSIALTANGINYGKHNIFSAIVSEMTDQDYRLPSFDVVKINTEDLDQYLGTYTSDEVPVDISMFKKDNNLYAQAPGQSSFLLRPEGGHLFSSMEIGFEITFAPENKAAIIKQHGMEFNMQLAEPAIAQDTVKIDLGKYAGTYESAQLPMDLTVSAENGQLIAQGTGQPSFSLKSEGGDIFSNAEIGLKITFHPEEKKLSFTQGGAMFMMTIKQE